MSTPRDLQLAPRDQALKAATRALVGAAGGQEAAAAFTRRRQSTVSDWCSPNTPAFIPADAIARLVEVTYGLPGQLDLVRRLAEITGHLLVRGGAPVDAGEEPLPLHLSRIATEGADVMRLLANPVAGVRHLDKAERQRLRAEACQLRDAAAELIHELDGADILSFRGRSPETG